MAAAGSIRRCGAEVELDHRQPVGPLRHVHDGVGKILLGVGSTSVEVAGVAELDVDEAVDETTGSLRSPQSVRKRPAVKAVARAICLARGAVVIEVAFEACGWLAVTSLWRSTKAACLAVGGAVPHRDAPSLR